MTRSSGGRCARPMQPREPLQRVLSASGTLHPMERLSRYAADIDLENENDSHVLIIQMIGGGKRILDVGCWTAEGAELLRPKSVRMVGIERDERAAAVAAERLDRVIVGDVESLDLDTTLEGEEFDVIVFGDVLEHLTDPTSALRRVRTLLAPGGEIIASIPNIAHGSVRLRLLQGEFRYADTGLLDRTHLRFFTRDTVDELFADAGLAIVETRCTTFDALQDPVSPLPLEGVDEAVLQRIADDPEASIYQFVVRAVVDDAERAIRDLYRRELDARRELVELRRSIGVVDRRDRDLLLLAVVGAGSDIPSSWCNDILRWEIERRLPGATVVLSEAPGPSTAQLRWVDAMVVLGDVPPDLRAMPDVVGVDVGPAKLHLPATDRSPRALGLALVAHRGVKTAESGLRSSVLRMTGALPTDGEYTVLAVRPGEVDDLEGLAVLLERLPEAATVVVLELDGDPTFARSIGSLRTGRATTLHQLEATETEDVLVAIAGASAVITTDLTVASMALALERPHALLRDDEDAAALLAMGGAVASTIATTEAALYRSRELVPAAQHLGSVQALVDTQLDEAASRLERTWLETGAAQPEPGYVDLLEDTVVALQRRLVDERLRLAAKFEDIESSLLRDGSGTEVRAALELRLSTLQAAAASYRSTIADLQEQLYAAAVSEPPPPPVEAITIRRLVKGVLRRLHLRG